jgi:hypothetical protein
MIDETMEGGSLETMMTPRGGNPGLLSGEHAGAWWPVRCQGNGTTSSHLIIIVLLTAH